MKQGTDNKSPLPLTRWFRREAARLGISVAAVMMRYYRGHYGNLRLWRQPNGRVFVLAGGMQPTKELLVTDRNVPGECACGRPGRRAGDKSWVCARCARIERWLYQHFHRDGGGKRDGECDLAGGLPEHKLHVTI